MGSFVYDNTGRVLVIHIERDGLVLERIEEALKEHGIRHGVVVSCIGTLQLAKMHFNKSKDIIANDYFFDVEGPIEFAVAQGLIIDGQPHVHCVLANQEKSYSGHLEYGSIVQNLMEIVILEIPSLDIIRKKNKYNIAYLDRP